MAMQKEESETQSTTVAVTGVEGSVLSMGEPMVDEVQLEFDFDADEDA